MFEKRLKDPEVLTLLSQVLNHKETMEKVSSVSLHGEKNLYNFYAMLILLDAIIKYQIIVGEDSFFPIYLRKLDILSTTFQSHKELVVGINSILGEVVRQQIGLPDLLSYPNKKAVLERVYDRYIVNGYCFHSFPSHFKKEVEFNGIDPKNYQYPIAPMKQISYIFKNHHYPNFITKNLEEKVPALYITDSPLMACYYAFSSPSYFSNMTATSSYMKSKEYDRFAYYRKDYKACQQNLKTISSHVGLSNQEEEIVLTSFDQQWKALDIEKATPCIAFIQRNEIGRDHLKDYAQILSDAAHEDFVISLSKITDSRYPEDRRFTAILPLNFTVEEMPTYQQIDKGRLQEERKKEIPTMIEQPIQKEEPSLHKTYQKVNNHGYADVIALFGMLSITVGLTMILIFRYFGIG